MLQWFQAGKLDTGNIKKREEEILHTAMCAMSLLLDA